MSRWIPRWPGRTSTRPGRGKGDLQAEPPGGVEDELDDHGLGRSRGGLTTKVHLACEQRQKPLSVIVTAGQRGDSPQFQVVLEAIRVPRPGGGHPRTRPDRVLADKAYGSCARGTLLACALATVALALISTDAVPLGASQRRCRAAATISARRFPRPRHPTRLRLGHGRAGPDHRGDPGRIRPAKTPLPRVLAGRGAGTIVRSAETRTSHG